MAWREYLNLFLKYEGGIKLATKREIEHADRGMDPVLAKRIAEIDYKRKERMRKNENNNENTQHTARSGKAVGGNSRFNYRLF